MTRSLQIKNNLAPYILLFVQPIFMATNTIVARGGVEYVPPISLAFWRWFFVFLILLPFFYSEFYKKRKFLKKEFHKLFFLGKRKQKGENRVSFGNKKKDPGQKGGGKIALN